MNHTPNRTATDLKDEIKKGLDHLRTLRDEVRVKLHLAGMEAKAEWNKLEPHLFDVEQKAHEASDASRHAVAEAVEKLKKLRDSL
jgi:predicted  nucleic acid-binding Zn-ribbon protein